MHQALVMLGLGDVFDEARRMTGRQLCFQVLNFLMIIFSALMIWKGESITLGTLHTLSCLCILIYTVPDSNGFTNAYFIVSVHFFILVCDSRFHKSINKMHLIYTVCDSNGFTNAFYLLICETV